MQSPLPEVAQTLVLLPAAPKMSDLSRNQQLEPRPCRWSAPASPGPGDIFRGQRELYIGNMQLFLEPVERALDAPGTEDAEGARGGGHLRGAQPHTSIPVPLQGFGEGMDGKGRQDPGPQP